MASIDVARIHENATSHTGILPGETGKFFLADQVTATVISDTSAATASPTVTEVRKDAIPIARRQR